MTNRTTNKLLSAVDQIKIDYKHEHMDDAVIHFADGYHKNS